MDSNKTASFEDLTKYFELRNSRFNARSTAAIAMGLSLFAVLITAYYSAIQQAINVNSLLLGYVISGVFVGAAVTLMVFLAKQISAISDSNFNKHFRWYLEAKSHFEANHQPEDVEAADLDLDPTQLEAVDATNEIDTPDESSNLKETEA